jgi:hypothetical protein
LNKAAAHFNEYGEKAANPQETVKEQGRTEKANRNIERKWLSNWGVVTKKQLRAARKIVHTGTYMNMQEQPE